MSKRRKSRRLALQLLYQNAVSGDSADETLAQLERWPQSVSEGQLKYVRQLFAGVLRRREEIDAALTPLLKNFSLSRLNTVDLNILRIAAYEMLHGVDVPPKVAINEAIELAHEFSSHDAPGFVNGVLDAFLRLHGPANPPVEEVIGEDEEDDDDNDDDGDRQLLLNFYG